jgi:hypothetical protein
MGHPVSRSSDPAVPRPDWHYYVTMYSVHTCNSELVQQGGHRAHNNKTSTFAPRACLCVARTAAARPPPSPIFPIDLPAEISSSNKQNQTNPLHTAPVNHVPEALTPRRRRLYSGRGRGAACRRTKPTSVTYTGTLSAFEQSTAGQISRIPSTPRSLALLGWFTCIVLCEETKPPRVVYCPVKVMF